MNPAIIQQAISYAPLAQRAVGAVGGLRGVVYRAMGFGQAEMTAGVPKWAWFVMGAAAGAVGMWFTKQHIEGWMER